MRAALLALSALALLGGCATTAGQFAEPAIAGVDTAERTIDYDRFESLTRELRTYREGRRVTLTEFKDMAAKPDALILDARSENAYRRGHIKGAINLPFTDFTAQSLAAAIGDADRPILIYCNNNFANNAQPVILKAAPLALNIPTFINLYGYGYKNIYELRDVIDFNDPKVEWVTG